MVGWQHLLNGHEFEQASGVGDVIQPSHPLSSSSPPALNLSQHQGLLSESASGGQSIRASALASAFPVNN